MPMKMTGKIELDAPPEEVWNILVDPESLKNLLNRIPGITVEKLVQVSEDKYDATAIIGVAMVKGKYDGTLTVVERRIPEYLKFRGEGNGGGNWTNGDMALTLTPQDGKTLLTYEGAGNVSGPLASVGQRLIDMVGKQIVANGTKALAEELARRKAADATGSPTSASAVPPPATPGQPSTRISPPNP